MKDLKLKVGDIRNWEDKIGIIVYEGTTDFVVMGIDGMSFTISKSKKGKIVRLNSFLRELLEKYAESFKTNWETSKKIEEIDKQLQDLNMTKYELTKQRDLSQSQKNKLRSIIMEFYKSKKYITEDY